MRVIILCFLMVLMVGMPAQAQDEGSSFMPLFLKPMVDSIKNTFTSRTPTIVQAEQQNTQNTTPQSRQDRLAGPGLVNNRNPWEGTSFGRIKNEIDYFDTDTQRYYNQYDYLALLARRGDQSQFNQVSQYLQQNGVFDPRKYQAALQGQSQAQQPQGQTGNLATGASGQSAPTQRTVRQVAPQQPTFAPKRIHEGYDEDMKADPQAQPRQGNQPIFLR